MSYTITTLVSDDYYKLYIPIFVYSARKAVPDAEIKIFYRGTLDKEIKSFCNCEFIENMFPEYPESESNTNALRFLVPTKHFNTRYIYFTDIDFIMLKHTPSLYTYMYNTLHRTKQLHAGHRGPKKVTLGDPFLKFTGKNSRIAAGAFFCHIDLLNRTEQKRKDYLTAIKNGACSFRSYDEIMLYRLLLDAKQETPITVGAYTDGKVYDITYRDVHLGDFKFTKRWKNTAKMKRKFLTDGNITEYRRLSNDSEWLKRVEYACQDRHIAMYFNALNKHVEHRGC